MAKVEQDKKLAECAQYQAWLNREKFKQATLDKIQSAKATPSKLGLSMNKNKFQSAVETYIDTEKDKIPPPKPEFFEEKAE